MYVLYYAVAAALKYPEIDGIYCPEIDESTGRKTEFPWGEGD